MAIEKGTSKPTSTAAKKKVVNSEPLFSRENYLWMIAGLVVMTIGFLLMAGGKSKDPNIFNDNDVNSFRRITLAPLFIVGGLVLEIVAIMKKPKAKTD